MHGLRAGRGMGMAVLELKLVQELDRMDQDLILLVLLDLQKA